MRMSPSGGTDLSGTLKGETLIPPRCDYKNNLERKKCDLDRSDTCTEVAYRHTMLVDRRCLLSQTPRRGSFSFPF